MTALMITQLVIALGPSALQLIQDLISVWNKPTLTVEEINSICSKAQKGYDSYIADAKAAQSPVIVREPPIA